MGGALIVILVVLLLLAVALAEILGVILLGVVVGIALSPLAELGTRAHIPRIASVLAVYALVGSVLVLFSWYAVLTIGDELSDVDAQLEALRARYEEFAAGTALPAVDDVLTYAQERVNEQLVADAASQALALGTIGIYLLTILVVGLLTTVSKDSARSLAVSLFVPEQRGEAAKFFDRVGHIWRRYVLATAATMTSVGLLTYAGLTVIGVPLAPLLAFIAFFTELLPIVGPWLGFVPAFLVAITDGPLTAIAVAVLYLVIQQVESYVLIPVIYGRGTKVPGLVLLTAVLIGFPLLGLIGALLALPVALLLYVLVMEVLVPWRQRQLGEPAETPAEAPPAA